jgi:hypothetical protein
MWSLFCYPSFVDLYRCMYSDLKDLHTAHLHLSVV